MIWMLLPVIQHDKILHPFVASKNTALDLLRSLSSASTFLTTCRSPVEQNLQQLMQFLDFKPLSLFSPTYSRARKTLSDSMDGRAWTEMLFVSGFRRQLSVVSFAQGSHRSLAHSPNLSHKTLPHTRWWLGWRERHALLAREFQFDGHERYCGIGAAESGWFPHIFPPLSPFDTVTEGRGSSAVVQEGTSYSWCDAIYLLSVSLIYDVN